MDKILTEKEKAKKLKALRKSYERAKSELGLPELERDGAIIDTIHMLVKASLPIREAIDKLNAGITVEDLFKAQQITPIDKATYMEFVKICAQKRSGKLKEKAIEKFENEFYNKLFIANLRHSFLESYMAGESLKITDKDAEEYSPFEDYMSMEFEKVMESSAMKYENITMTLQKQLKEYGKAAEYATLLKLKWSDFKALVDYEYNKDGGYPSPDSPSKLWNMFDKFVHMYKLMDEYDFTQHKDLAYEHGLKLEIGEPHPVQHKWMEYEVEE